MEHKKAVGIWIRVSTEDQARGDSPEHHEQRARHYASAKDWDVKEVYHLEAVSGKSVMDQPETKRMLKDIKEGRITGLIFSKLARLARNTRELLDFSDLFRKNNADLVSLAESIDTSTPAGRLFYTLIAAMAQWEREEIADRVAASVPIRAKMGKPLGGQAAFGYKWEGKNWNGVKWQTKEYEIDKKEAPVRKLIYELFLKHKRKKTVAKELNSMGYRTRNGSAFSDTTIDRLLRDASAKGERRANYTKSLGDDKNWEIKPASEWVITACPAIVNEDLWNECNRILAEQEVKHKKPGPQPVHMLSGYIHCTCGNKMYIYHNNNVFVCKACKTRIAADAIDTIYHEQLKTFLLTDVDLNDYLKQTDGIIQEKETLLQMVVKESNILRQKAKELIDMRTNRELTPESFMEHHKPLELRLSQIQEQLPKLESELDILKVHNLSSNVVLQDAKNLYDRWLTLSFEERRTIIEVITEMIVVGAEDVTISLSYLPTLLPTLLQNGGNKQHNFRGSLTKPT